MTIPLPSAGDFSGVLQVQVILVLATHPEHAQVGRASVRTMPSFLTGLH